MIDHSDLVARIQQSKDYTSIIQAAFASCRSVLEPGCQFGWNLSKLQGVPVRVGVEVHQPYLTDSRAVKHAQIQYVRADALQYLPQREDQSFDGIMLMDFVEHFNKPQGEYILDDAKRIASKRVLIWAPMGEHPQDYDEWNLGGEKWQTHRWTLMPGDLVKHGYSVIVWKDHHPPKNIKGQLRSRDAMWGVWTR
jgi:hypothetical protein